MAPGGAAVHAALTAGGRAWSPRTMTLARAALAALAATLVVAGLHARINLGWGTAPAQVGPPPLEIGFLPVTCHLTCPVNHWIKENLEGNGGFVPRKFSGWPELKEAFISGSTQASFLLAPMAMVLAKQGVPLKIVYLGHRDGTALMVHKDSDIRSIADLRGKVIAVPNRFSNQRLIIAKALQAAGVAESEVTIKEMPPPDMPAALSVKAVDLICSGEPFMGQAELDGYGRVLYQAKELWPGFISCVLVAHQRLIDEEPERLQAIVDGIARSGKWLEAGLENRMAGADAVARNYYNQDPRLLRFVLSKPPDRVTYDRLMLAKPDFLEIEALARRIGILEGPIAFEDYADVRFSERTSGATAYTWSPPR